MTVELQSLVIQSTMEHVITNLRDTILIVPEAWEHIPQGRNTPVKLYAETFIRKGAAIGNYLFIDSQDIAGIDKMPLRQCNNWILGRQREGHEKNINDNFININYRHGVLEWMYKPTTGIPSNFHLQI
jgi:DNA helicase HerA-like ATPase